MELWSEDGHSKITKKVLLFGLVNGLPDSGLPSGHSFMSGC